MNFKFALVTGESQAGKSTIINCVAGKKVAEVGDGNGHSITLNSSVYTSKANQLHLMDSPGGIDTNLRSDQDILTEIEYAITKKSSKTLVDAVLLVESLTSDTMQLQRNLKRLKTTFGPNILQSIIVLGSKPNLSKILYGDTRINAVSQECKRFHLKFMSFETYSNYQHKTMINGGQLNNQMNSLKALISQTKPYKMNTLIKIRQSIQNTANDLMKAAPIQYKIKHYNESYSEPYTTSESYNDTESYQTTEPYQTVEYYTENVWDVIGKETNWRKYGRRPKKKYGWVSVGRTRTVTKQRSITKTRSVIKYKNVTKYRTATRSKSMKVAIPKDINIYTAKATNQWEQQMKNSLKTQINFV